MFSPFSNRAQVSKHLFSEACASGSIGSCDGQNQNYVAWHQPVGGSYQWKLQAQRQIGSNMVASLAYVASHGHDLPFPVDLNEVPEGQLAPNDQQFRPYQQFGTLAVTGTVAGENVVSNYNSLQASIEKRLTQALSFSFNYVWSHFLSDMDSAGWGSHSGAQYWQRAYKPSANYGNSNFDVRNAFKGNVLYQLLFGQGRQFLNNNRLLDAAIGGWQVASTIVVQSGQPFTTIMSDGTNSYSLAGSNFAWYPECHWEFETYRPQSRSLVQRDGLRSPNLRNLRQRRP